MLVLALLTFVIPAFRSFAAVREIGPIGLTVGDLKRELAFYTNTLPFELLSISDESGPDQESLLGLKNAHVRIATLRLGHERITLTEHVANPGKPVPPDSRSFDYWFQHIAIVVSDMHKAYARLREHNVKHISTAPQTLPDWNKNAGGIKAFYFRDPEDHVLEIIWFPAGKGDPKWQVKPSTLNPQLSTLFLGIDHTAIVLSLYLEALVHFLGGADQVIRSVPLVRDGIALGSQHFHLLTPEVAFRLTAMPSMSTDYERQLQSLLNLTPLRRLQWINMAHHEVHFITLTK